MLKLLSQPGFSNDCFKEIGSLITLFVTLLEDIKQTKNVSAASFTLKTFIKFYTLLSRSFDKNPKVLHLALKALPIVLIDQKVITEEFKLIYQKIVLNNPLLFPKVTKHALAIQPKIQPKKKGQKLLKEPQVNIDMEAHRILFNAFTRLENEEKVNGSLINLAISHLKMILTTSSMEKALIKDFFELFKVQAQQFFKKSPSLITESLFLINFGKGKRIFSEKKAYALAYDIVMCAAEPNEFIATYRYTMKNQKQHLCLWLLHTMVELRIDIKYSLTPNRSFISTLFDHFVQKRIILHPSQELFQLLVMNPEIIDDASLHPFLIALLDQDFQPEWVDKHQLNHMLAKILSSCLDMGIETKNSALVYLTLQCLHKFQELDFYKQKSFIIKTLYASPLLLAASPDNIAPMRHFYINLFNPTNENEIRIMVSSPENGLEYAQNFLAGIFNANITDLDNTKLAIMTIEQNFDLILEYLPLSLSIALRWFDRLIYSSRFSRQQADERFLEVEVMHLQICQNIMHAMLKFDLTISKSENSLALQAINNEFELYKQINTQQVVKAKTNAAIITYFLAKLSENVSERKLFILSQTLKYFISRINTYEEGLSLLKLYLKAKCHDYKLTISESQSIFDYFEVLSYLYDNLSNPLTAKRTSRQISSHLHEIVCHYTSIIRTKTKAFFSALTMSTTSCATQHRLADCVYLLIKKALDNQQIVMLKTYVDYIEICHITRKFLEANDPDGPLNLKDFEVKISEMLTCAHKDYGLKNVAAQLTISGLLS